MAKGRGKGNYVVNTFNGMAYGFFASLIIGTILKQLGNVMNIGELVTWGNIASYLMGPAIGIGMGYAIEARGFNISCHCRSNRSRDFPKWKCSSGKSYFCLCCGTSCN